MEKRLGHFESRICSRICFGLQKSLQVPDANANARLSVSPNVLKHVRLTGGYFYFFIDSFLSENESFNKW